MCVMSSSTDFSTLCSKISDDDSRNTWTMDNKSWLMGEKETSIREQLWQKNSIGWCQQLSAQNSQNFSEHPLISGSQNDTLQLLQQCPTRQYSSDTVKNRCSLRHENISWRNNFRLATMCRCSLLCKIRTIEIYFEIQVLHLLTLSVNHVEKN